MSGGELMVVGGRKILVDANAAKMIRRRQEQLRERDRRTARELKEAGMLPSGPGNQFAGWISQS